MPAKEPGFMERLQTAAKAKKAQLEKIRASAATNSAKSTGRQAAQVEAAAARKIRTAGRKDSDRGWGPNREKLNAQLRTLGKLSPSLMKGRARRSNAVPKQRPMPPLKRIRRRRATPNTPHVKFGKNRPSRAVEPHTCVVRPDSKAGLLRAVTGVLSTDYQVLNATSTGGRQGPLQARIHLEKRRSRTSRSGIPVLPSFFA